MSYTVSEADPPSPELVVPDVPVIAPPSYNEPIVTRRELWSYYLYYNGDNGVGPFTYSFILFQALTVAAGYDPVRGPGSSCLDDNASGRCVVPWGNGTKAVTSVVLIANGTSFALSGRLWDVGKWPLLVTTLICWATQFASVTLTSASLWGVAMGLYMISFISYGATLVFYAAAFPRLARNTQHSRDLREKFDHGEIPVEVYEREESLEKNRISNISTTHSNIGYIVTMALNLSLLLPLRDNPKVDNYIIVLTNGYWVLTGIWWSSTGPKLPKGEKYLTIGWKQTWAALKQYKELPYTFTYLIAFFFLADGLNTTGTLVAICQNDKFSFSFLQVTYLGLAQAATSTASTLGFWYIQRHWKISTKKMFGVTNVVTVLIPLWGMIGVWTPKFGFHNTWEFWAYNVVFGLFQAPYYAFSQTMMAELSPPGFDNMVRLINLFPISSLKKDTR
ncbi:autophagy-related protein 22-like protein [Lactifluus volemus]|nr:autophagy-related protein 22-like protein [Lactifluus volemus]